MITLCVPMNLWHTTRIALRSHAPDAIIKKIRTDTIEEPWSTYRQYWGTDDLMIVEQDIVIHEDVIPQFESCPEPWCLFPFPHYAEGGGLMMSGVGCNRFRREFMEAVTVEDIESQYASCILCEGNNPRCWKHIDGRINDAGHARGFEIHVHYPPVGHRIDMS